MSETDPVLPPGLPPLLLVVLLDTPHWGPAVRGRPGGLLVPQHQPGGDSQVQTAPLHLPEYHAAEASYQGTQNPYEGNFLPFAVSLRHKILSVEATFIMP